MSSIASTPTLTHDRAHKQIFRPFPTPLNWRQWGYILVMQGCFAALINFGANFGIAVASESECSRGRKGRRGADAAVYSSQKDVRVSLEFGCQHNSSSE